MSKKTEGVTPIRKTKIDFIPAEMIDEFNAIQLALANAKGRAKRDLSKLSPEELEIRRAKAAKRLAALEAALKG